MGGQSLVHRCIVPVAQCLHAVRMHRVGPGERGYSECLKFRMIISSSSQEFPYEEAIIGIGHRWRCAAGGAFAQANDTLAKIKASGVITEGVRESSGLSYTLGNGQYTGFHYDVCANIIKDLEKAVGKKLETKYQPVTSQNRIPLVQNGTVDLECGSTTNNATRQKDVAFAVTTYVEEVRIAVKANSGINSHQGPQRQDRRHHHRHHLGPDRCARTSAPAASTSRRCTARTTPTASCCWNPAVPMPS